jgi:DNA-binding NarL/FixJ family response regulator
MKVLLATGVHELNMAIQMRLRNLEYTSICFYKEAVADMVRNSQPDVLLISELLEGKISIDRTIKLAHETIPDLKIVILTAGTPSALCSYYTYLDSKFTIDELIDAFNRAKTCKELDVKVRLLLAMT